METLTNAHTTHLENMVNSEEKQSRKCQNTKNDLKSAPRCRKRPKKCIVTQKGGQKVPTTLNKQISPRLCHLPLSRYL